jgi:hypothetical protein
VTRKLNGNGNKKIKEYGINSFRLRLKVEFLDFF